MPEPFVPAGFEPPEPPSHDDFVLEPLGPEHNERDHAAWMSSIDHIRSTPGFPVGGWPTAMSLDENLGDLERHAADFTARTGFTYTVLSPTDRDVIGCVYIYPSKEGAHDASVRSWVRSGTWSRIGSPPAGRSIGSTTPLVHARSPGGTGRDARLTRMRQGRDTPATVAVRISLPPGVNDA